MWQEIKAMQTDVELFDSELLIMSNMQIINYLLEMNGKSKDIAVLDVCLL